jgi:hypothetical protein
MPVIIDGTNGVSTPNTFAFKNRLINAQLLINQRGVSGTVTLSAGAYGHDRFKAGASGCTYTFATTNNVTTLTISAGSLQQVIEGLNLESGTYTLSWTGTVQGKIGAGSYGASGITGSITGGTNTTIEFNTGTLSLPQLEVGSTATSFDYRPYGTELALCQRYYYQIGGTFDGSSNYYEIGMGIANSGSQAYCLVEHRVTMRASPTLTYDTIRLQNVSNSYPITSASIATVNASKNKTLIICNVSSGLVSTLPYYIDVNNSSTGYLGLSSEL